MIIETSLEEICQMTKVYKCMLQFHKKKLVAQFLIRKMTRNRMNEIPEN